ncbi:DNA repair exonuclease [Lactobacillaceae bacterium 24-114]
MKFIHTADLHLDSPFSGLTEVSPELWERIYQSTFVAFERIVDAAINNQVDFMLIIGDIYDRDHHSAKAEDFFIRQCQRLEEAEIHVYLSYGNHDYQVVDDNKYLPENVHVFSNQGETKRLTLPDGKSIAITGFSYGQRWLSNNQTALYPNKGQEDWHIGMLHGAVQKNNPNQDHYAPFTIQDLIEKHYDYWALGHIHSHQILSSEPPIVYCGDPQGRNKNEGGQHGFYLVQDHNGTLVPQFNPIADIEWGMVPAIASKEISSSSSLIDFLIQTVGKNEQFKMIQFNLHSQNLAPIVIQQVNSGATLEQLQSQIEQEGRINWWPYQIKIIDQEEMPTMTNLDEQYWKKAASEVFRTEELVEKAGKLANYDFINQALEDSGTIDELQSMALKKLGLGK